jgi:tRNA(Ile)-lysidine synthase
MTVPRLAVAVSGGIDSTALLHCTVRQAAALGAEVHALHVHHGLQPQADAWMAQVAAQCARWRRAGRPVQFHAHRVLARPAPGDSVDAWARRVRYAALAEMAHAAGCRVVLLGHHRRDQAETVLLQALRGAGPPGLAAMPREIERDGLRWIRPWLDQPRAAIEAYARRWRLRTVADPSNADDRHARSRLRQRVWPALLQRFPDAELSLAHVARRAQEARALIDEVAAADCAAVVAEQALQLPAWLSLSLARRAAVLRHALPTWMSAPLPETLVQRLQAELPHATQGAWPAPGGMLRLHRGRLRFVPAPAGPAPWRPSPAVIDLGQPGAHRLPGWPGSLHVRAVEHGGVPAAALQAAVVQGREGGERFQARADGVPRSLKKQYQSAGVPAWSREGPLVWAAGHLVFVAGLGLDARARAWSGRPRVDLRWQPDGAGPAAQGSGKPAG